MRQEGEDGLALTEGKRFVSRVSAGKGQEQSLRTYRQLGQTASLTSPQETHVDL